MITRFKLLRNQNFLDICARGVQLQTLRPSIIKKHVTCTCINFSNQQDAFSTTPKQFKNLSNWQHANRSISTSSNLFYYQRNLSNRMNSTPSHPCPAPLLRFNNILVPFKISNSNASQQSEARYKVESSFVNKEKLWKSKAIINDLEETKAKMKEKVGQIIERENIWTIPNFLCVSRIIMTPALCYSVIISSYPLALWMFIVAGFTDLIDGMIARAFPSQASRLGSFLDPLADKILVSSLFLTLTYVGLIPFMLTFVIVYRDLVIIAGASYVRYKSLPPPHTLSRYFDATHATAQLTPTFMSKMNTAIQIVLITTSLGAPVFGYTDHYLLQTLWFVTGLTTFASGIGYIFSKESYKILSSSKNK